MIRAKNAILSKSKIEAHDSKFKSFQRNLNEVLAVKWNLKFNLIIFKYLFKKIFI